MIYQLNSETHWHVSPAAMRALVSLVDVRLAVAPSIPEPLIVELCNFRAALECELQRLPANNSDLTS